MPTEALRTREERFSLLPAFPYRPRYVDDLRGYDSLRMAYSTRVTRHLLLLFCVCIVSQRGYLYRKMIPVLTAAGYRALAPDLFGFGRSDKATCESTYTFDFHMESLIRFIERLDLNNITLICQDCGGILGLTIPMDMPKRFTRLLVMNTAIPIGEPLSGGFAKWKAFAARAPEIPVGGMLAFDALSAVGLMDVLAYKAPFPDNNYKAGVRRFPQLVPVTPEMEGAELDKCAFQFWSNEWRGDSFMVIGMRDRVLVEGPMEILKKYDSQLPRTIEGGGSGSLCSGVWSRHCQGRAKAFWHE